MGLQSLMMKTEDYSWLWNQEMAAIKVCFRLKQTANGSGRACQEWMLTPSQRSIIPAPPFYLPMRVDTLV